MAERGESRERELVLQRFYELPTGEQFAVHRTLKGHLGRRIRETARDRVVAERAAALEALTTVAEELGLDGRAPTPSQFDETAKRLGLVWTRARVQRAWGKWRFAREALLGSRLPEAASIRDARRAQEGRRQKRATPMEGVRWWLATNPKSLAAAGYLAWAREHNETRGPDELLVVTRAYHVAKQLGMSWGDVIRAARGEIAMAEASRRPRVPRERICRGPHDLVSYHDVTGILAGFGNIFRRTLQRAFPRPVLVFDRHRFWLREDVEAYRDGRDLAERTENELRPLYLTRDEVAAKTGFAPGTVHYRGGAVPPCVVRLGRVTLWLVEEVEEFLYEREYAKSSAH